MSTRLKCDGCSKPFPCDVDVYKCFACKMEFCEACAARHFHGNVHTACLAPASASPEPAGGLADETRALRRLLWLRHAPDHTGYGDDGEMSCSRCFIDFKRDSVEDIEKRFAEMGAEKLRASASLPAAARQKQKEGM